MAQPAGSTMIGGVAVSADGAVYVTSDPASAWSATTFLSGNGSVSANGYQVGVAGTGLYRDSSTQRLIAAVAGFNGMAFAADFAYLSSTGQLGWTNGSILASPDTAISRPSANALQFGTSNATTTARTEINKAVAAIADATPTATFTITVPNAAHSASVLVRVTGSLGAGGAIGANEASASNSYVITIARTAGVNAVAAISSAFGAAAAAVAGAATVTCTAAMSSVSGAVGATNTFTVNVTITRSGGSSTNHTCLCYAQLMNANATGITIA